MDQELSEDFNDSDDMLLKSSKKKRKRTVIGSEQLMELEKCFNDDQWPSRDKKIELGSQIGASKKFVSVWFQNKRAKLRKGGSKEDTPEPTPICNTIKLPIPRNKCSESTSDVNKANRQKTLSKSTSSSGIESDRSKLRHRQSKSKNQEAPHKSPVVAGPVSLMKQMATVHLPTSTSVPLTNQMTTPPATSTATGTATKQSNLHHSIKLKLAKVSHSNPDIRGWTANSILPVSKSTSASELSSPRTSSSAFTAVSVTNVQLPTPAAVSVTGTTPVDASHQPQQPLVQVPPLSDHSYWFCRPPCMPPRTSLFQNIIGMMAVAEGGIVQPGSAEFETCINSFLYGIKIAGNNRLIYTKGVGFDVEALPDD